MKERFKKIFLVSIEVINWLESPGFLGRMRAGNILLGMFILIGGLLYFIEGVSLVLNGILMGLLEITTFTLLFILSLRSYWLKPPKFIRKEAVNPAQLFDRLSHWSFFYGIIVYSFFASFFIECIYIAFIKLILHINFDFSRSFYNLFFSTTAVFSVCYFMYHVSVKDVSIKAIKARIRLYLAIIATITIGLFGFSLKEILLPLITYLGVGLAWLSFFVEQVESEEKDSSSKKLSDEKRLEKAEVRIKYLEDELELLKKGRRTRKEGEELSLITNEKNTEL
ncbi:hypothetical protein [Rummeliibacillus pycnus]|uniref:hypothetical protein n=1 Tax=Rummeliibacillus pycnus TaxID=101070 RepID=UPI003D2B7CC2